MLTVVKAIQKSYLVYKYVEKAVEVHKFLPTVRFQHTSTNCGLYSLPELQSHQDFKSMTKNAIENINRIRGILRENSKSLANVGNNNNQSSTVLSSREILQLLDAISNEVCSVIDVAELCRQSHTSSNFVEAANDSFSTLSDFINQLNGDKQLYNSLCEVIHHEHYQKEWKDVLDEEERYFAFDLRKDFERDGIHLPDELKAKLLQLQATITDLETEFSNNTIQDTSMMQLGPIRLRDQLQTVQGMAQRYQIPQNRGNSSDTVTISLNNRIVYPLLNYLHSEDLRRDLWLQHYFQPQSNINTLVNLVTERQKLAKFQGFSSFAHKALFKNVEKDPAQVQNLLTELSRVSMSKTSEEVKQLTHTKAVLINNSPAQLNPWDIGYCQQRLQRDLGYSTAQTDKQRLRPYLSVDNCLRGMLRVTEMLYNVKIYEEDIDPDTSEQWLTNNQNKMNKKKNSLFNFLGNQKDDSKVVNNNDFVRKFQLYTVNSNTGKEEHLGTCYFDLFARKNKFQGTAHYVVRCGCEKVTNIPRSLHTNTISTTWQTPIVVLLFQFDSSSSSNNDSQMSTKNTFLSLSELEQLFHEWGHAMHSMFSSTKFQHLSGTRGGTDFIEIPSHLFEYFARSKEVLQSIARHHITNEPAPIELVDSVLGVIDGDSDGLKNNKPFIGIDIQTQLLYAAADQMLFNGELGDLTNKSNEYIFEHILHQVAFLQNNITALPTAQISRDNIFGSGSSRPINVPSMHLLTHTHFLNYAGSYYAYLYAKIVAAQIYQKLFISDPLNSSAGEKLRRELLMPGASKNGKELLKNLLGDSHLDVNHYWKTQQ